MHTQQTTPNTQIRLDFLLGSNSKPKNNVVVCERQNQIQHLSSRGRVEKQDLSVPAEAVKVVRFFGPGRTKPCPSLEISNVCKRVFFSNFAFKKFSKILPEKIY